MAAEPARKGSTQTNQEPHEWPILVGVLGGFRLVKAGQPIPVRGGKTEGLLSSLALQPEQPQPREVLLEGLWPDSDPMLATQALNSLVYHVHKLLGDALDGAAPILHMGGCYVLNLEAGIGVDVARFRTLVSTGDQHERAGERAAAVASYARAVDLYRGDVVAGSSIQALVQREHLRALYLTLLARLADAAFEAGDLPGCRVYALRLLQSDPCREDAHRLLMRCYTRLGERAQALRQYRLCESILRREFAAAPEPITTALYDEVRLRPTSV